MRRGKDSDEAIILWAITSLLLRIFRTLCHIGAGDTEDGTRVRAGKGSAELFSNIDSSMVRLFVRIT